MRRLKLAAGGLALLLLLSLLVTSCNSLVFGRLAQAEPAWAHMVTGQHIRLINADDRRYAVKVYYCCITASGPPDCYQTIRGISVPKHAVEAEAMGEAGIPYAWHSLNLQATQTCRKLL